MALSMNVVRPNPRIMGVLLALLLLSHTALASHSRAVIFTTTVMESTRTPTDVTVSFTYIGSWRLSWYTVCPPAPEFYFQQGFTFIFGDGANTKFYCTTNAYDCDLDLIQCEGQFNHTYSTTSVAERDWTYLGCCRINAIGNTGSGSSIVKGTIQLAEGANANSPRSGQQPVTPMCVTDPGETTSFQVSGFDIEDGNNVDYSIAPPPDFGPDPPPFLTIDPSGTVTGDTSSYANTIWAIQVVVADQGGSSTGVDFLVEVAGDCSSSVDPTFLNETAITLADGTTVVTNAIADQFLSVPCDGSTVDLFIGGQGANGVDVRIQLETFSAALPPWLTLTTGISMNDFPDGTSDLAHLTGTRTADDWEAVYVSFVVKELSEPSLVSLGTISVGIDECPPAVVTNAPTPQVTTAPTPLVTEAPLPTQTNAPTPMVTAAPSPEVTMMPTAQPSPPPTLAPCPYSGNDGNLEILYPPLLDEHNTHLVFTGNENNMKVRIIIPRQYLTHKFSFEGATNHTSEYDSTNTSANVYWTLDNTDSCDYIYTAVIPWHLFRAGLGGLVETRFSFAVVYETQINIEVTKLLYLTPFAQKKLLADKPAIAAADGSGKELEQFVQERIVRTKIPFTVTFDLAVNLTATAAVRSDYLRVTAILTETTVENVEPSANPVGAAFLEFVTLLPLPLHLNDSAIAVDDPDLAHGLSIYELTDKANCTVGNEICVQYFRVDIFPYKCTLDGIYTATVFGQCHPDEDNCVPFVAPDNNTAEIVLTIKSDDFCGVTQEVDISGALQLTSTTCNTNIDGSVNVWNSDGAAINSTDILEVYAAPTMTGGTMTVMREDLGVTTLGYTDNMTLPDQVDFQFIWDGSQLRCDVAATVEVVVLVEFQATAPRLLSYVDLPRPKRKQKRHNGIELEDDNELIFAGSAPISPGESSPLDAAGIGAGVGAPTTGKASAGAATTSEQLAEGESSIPNGLVIGAAVVLALGTGVVCVGAGGYMAYKHFSSA